MWRIVIWMGSVGKGFGPIGMIIGLIITIGGGFIGGRFSKR